MIVKVQIEINLLGEEFFSFGNNVLCERNRMKEKEAERKEKGNLNTPNLE